MKLNQLFITLILSACLQGPAQAMQFPQSLVSGETVDSFKKTIIDSIQNHPKIAAASVIGLAILHPQVRKFIQKYIGHTDANPNELRWNWAERNTEDVNFPIITKDGEEFLWGAAVCALQTEGIDEEVGLPHCNWAHWIKHGPQELNLQDAGKACDSWVQYKRDIEMLKELGLNCYRFSVDWSRIEPQQGQIDQAALEKYVQICDDLLAAGIKPVVTLHHFVHPQWFEEIGGFAKADNIKYFVDFSKLVYQTLGNRVAIWCTINEPGIFTMQGYIRGVYPPGKSAGPTNLFSAYKLAANVLQNLLDAHVEVYHAIKALPGGQEAKVGIVHQYLKFEAFHGKWSPAKSALEHVVASSFDWVHKTVIEYFKTGTFHMYVRGICNVQDATNQERRTSALDYIGLNYYSHPLIRVHHRLKDPVFPGQREYDIKTGMPFNVYAEGLYRAIQHVAELNKPIYITENGAPSSDNVVKDVWSKRYLYALSEAIKDGYDVRGYMYWSLLDNYEWDMGYHQQFGLYHVDFASAEKTRTLTEGAQYFQQVMLAEQAKRSALKVTETPEEKTAEVAQEPAV